MITRIEEVVDYENRWIQVCFDHVRFPNGADGRYTRIRHRSGISGVVVVAVRATASQVSVGLIEGFRYPVGRVCTEAVRGFGETGDHEDARRELAEELGVDGLLVTLGSIDPDTGMVELPVRLYGCLVTGDRVVDPDPTEFVTASWFPVDQMWAAVADGRISCAMTLAALLRAQLAGLIPLPGTDPAVHLHRALETVAASGVDPGQVAVLREHPSPSVRAAAAGNRHIR